MPVSENARSLKLRLSQVQKAILRCRAVEQAAAVPITENARSLKLLLSTTMQKALGATAFTFLHANTCEVRMLHVSMIYELLLLVC